MNNRVHHTARRNTRQYTRTYVAWLVFILAALGAFLVVTRQYTYRLISRNSANEAEVLSRSLESTLRRVQATSLWAEQQVQLFGSDGGARAAFLRGLQALAHLFPEVHGFTLLDLHGASLFSTFDHDSQCSVSHIPEDLILLPRRFSFSDTSDCMVSNSRVITANTLLYDAHGVPAAIFSAVVNLSYYEDAFSRVDVGDTGMVSIRRSDTSALVVRWPVQAERINNRAPHIPPQELITAGERLGVVRYTGATDGVERVFAFNRVAGYPFYVLVGRGTWEQFSTWRALGIIAVIIAGAMIVLTTVLLRNVARSHRNMAEAYRDKEQLVRELLHRTNNSLQVIRSLVQMERVWSGRPDEQNALHRLEYRLQVLSLIQRMLREETGYSRIAFDGYLQALWNQVFSRHGGTGSPGTPRGITVAVRCPHMELGLDIAAPLGLMVGELLHGSVRCPGDDHREVTITVVPPTGENRNCILEYYDRCAVDVPPEVESLVNALATHQLRGTLQLETAGELRCAVSFSPDLYTKRVRS